jgi:hypothetical protein
MSESKNPQPETGKNWQEDHPDAPKVRPGTATKGQNNPPNGKILNH